MLLDEEFIREDVAGLSLMAYEDTIRDGYFFQDTDLMRMYFMNTYDVKWLFGYIYMVFDVV